MPLRHRSQISPRLARVWVNGVLFVGFCIPCVATAQVTCTLTTSAADRYRGTCIAQRDTLARVEVQASSTPLTLWRGTSISGNGTSMITALDTAGRIYRDARGWYKLSGLAVRNDTLNFVISLDGTAAPSNDDLEILRRARTYLGDSSHWSHTSDGDVAQVATEFFQHPELSRGGYCTQAPRRTLFCALYQASLDVAGEFWWGRPAINAVRAAVLADPRSHLRHPLMQFNGAPETKLEDVQRVLDVASAFLAERQSCVIQQWVWGSNRLCR